MDAPPSILIVDDSESIRAMLRHPLEAQGWDVDLAGTADEALVLAAELAPDVIILDFVLPDADGLVLLRELRRRGVDAAVIGLTGSSSTEVAYRFLRAGAADFLMKDGLASGEVVSAVRRALLLRKVGVHVTAGRPRLDEPENEEPPQSLLDDPAEESAAPTHPLRVLVVDDTEVARRAVRAVLGREGWSIDEAQDLREAVASVAKVAPDIVLLDYLLPDVDGIEAIPQLRDAGLRAPIIGLTGHGSEDLATRFLRAGAADFLPKDELSEARLVHAIRRVVALHAARP